MGSNGARRPFAAGMGHGTGGGRGWALSQRLCWSGSREKKESTAGRLRLPWERRLGSLRCRLGVARDKLRWGGKVEPGGRWEEDFGRDGRDGMVMGR